MIGPSVELYRSPKQLQRLDVPAGHLAFSLIPSFFFSSSLKACSCEDFYLLRLLQYLALSLSFSLAYIFCLIQWTGASRSACEWKNRCWKECQRSWITWLVKISGAVIHSVYIERDAWNTWHCNLTFKMEVFCSSKTRSFRSWMEVIIMQSTFLSVHLSNNTLSLTHLHLWSHK